MGECIRSSPEGDRKALWSPPQRRNPCPNKINEHRKTLLKSLRRSAYSSTKCFTASKTPAEWQYGDTYATSGFTFASAFCTVAVCPAKRSIC